MVISSNPQNIEGRFLDGGVNLLEIAQKSFGNMNYTENITFSTRLINAMVSYLEYLRKMVWPEKLAMFYPHAGNRGSIFLRATLSNHL